MEGLAETKMPEEMTQNQITTLLDFVKVGEKLRIYCFWEPEGIETSGMVVSKEPDIGPLRQLRQITKVNLKGGLFLERKQRTNDDFTNWGYGDEQQKTIILAVTIEK